MSTANGWKGRRRRRGGGRGEEEEDQQRSLSSRRCKQSCFLRSCWASQIFIQMCVLPIMPAVAASEPKKEIKAFFFFPKHNQIHLSSAEPGFDASLNWTNMAVKSDWLFPVFFSSKNVTLPPPPFISLYFKILSIYFERCSAVKVICARTLAACSQTRCSLWFGLDEELFGSQAFFFFSSFGTERDIMLTKRHSAHLFEDGGFS